jgi:hypothetical protein
MAEQSTKVVKHKAWKEFMAVKLLVHSQYLSRTMALLLESDLLYMVIIVVVLVIVSWSLHR